MIERWSSGPLEFWGQERSLRFAAQCGDQCGSHPGLQDLPLPRKGQRIVLFHVRMKGGVREGLQAGRVIRDYILRSREIRGGAVVAVEPLVVAGHLAEVGGWAYG